MVTRINSAMVDKDGTAITTVPIDSDELWSTPYNANRLMTIITEAKSPTKNNDKIKSEIDVFFPVDESELNAFKDMPKHYFE